MILYTPDLTIALAELNTPEGEKLNILVTLIETHERKHFTLDKK